MNSIDIEIKIRFYDQHFGDLSPLTITFRPNDNGQTWKYEDDVTTIHANTPTELANEIERNITTLSGEMYNKFIDALTMINCQNTNLVL